MADSAELTPLECGNCGACGQHHVLGQNLRGSTGDEVFCCCACIDRSDSVSELLASIGDAQDVRPPTNWWACDDAPTLLAEVPPGQLTWDITELNVRGAITTIRTVADPEHNYFMGPGAERAWPAAVTLAKTLLMEPCEGRRVVELGAGCGLTGIALAKHGAKVTLTDVPWLLQLARYNVEANFSDTDPLRPTVASLRWGCADDVAAVLDDEGPPDFAIGSDIVYRDEDLDILLSTLRSLGARRVVLAVVQRESILPSFRKKLSAHGYHANMRGDDGIHIASIMSAPNAMTPSTASNASMASRGSRKRRFGSSRKEFHSSARHTMSKFAVRDV